MTLFSKGTVNIDNNVDIMKIIMVLTIILKYTLPIKIEI